MRTRLETGGSPGFWPTAIVAASLLALLLGESEAAPAGGRTRGAATVARMLEALPLRFEANVGQADPRALFVARGRRSTLFLTSSDAVLAMAAEAGEPRQALRMAFVGARTPRAVTGEQELSGRTHYLVGPESEWRRDVVSYSRVRYQELYPGVDVVFYGREREIEFDLVVAAGADPGQVAIDIEGGKPQLDAAGDLVLDLGHGEVRLKRPVAHQDADGVRRSVESAFVLTGSRLAFSLGGYDPSRPVVIDPVVVYATYLGGRFDDSVAGIGEDAAGNVYVAGWTNSVDFPLAAPLFDNHLKFLFPLAPYDAFVAKLNPSGSALIYSTYLGGEQGDGANDLAVDAAGQAYVVGGTTSPDFPVTANAFQSTRTGFSDAFVSKLSPDGSALLFSTLLGTSGSNAAIDVDVDDAGAAYVLGQAGGPGFPLTADAYSTNYFFGYFLARFNTMLSGAASLEYSSFAGIGGGNVDSFHMDATPDGRVYIVGSQLDVPAVNGFQTSRVIDPRYGSPSADAAFLRVNTRAADPAQAVEYATYLGGNAADYGLGISARSDGLVCLVGQSEAADFPTRHGFQTTIAGTNDAFAAVFDTSLSGDASLVYSTLLGGFNNDAAMRCGLDSAGRLHVAGETRSTDFPLRAPFQAVFGGGQDIFAATIDPKLDGPASLVSSSYIGGDGEEELGAFRLAPEGHEWLAGLTRSFADFPVRNAFQPAHAPGRPDDGFLVKLAEDTTPNPNAFLVSAVSPASGGDGMVTAVVHGVGFANGASVRLVGAGGEAVVGDPVKFIGDAALQAVLNLSGRTAGSWDVVVTNPDGRTATLPGAFRVEARSVQIRASASVVMSPIQRFGRAATGYITYTNPSNVDVMLPIFIYYPKGKTLDFGIPIRHGPSIPGGPVDFSGMPRVFDLGAEQMVALIVNVPPGYTGVIPITVPEGCDPLRPTAIRVATGTPQPGVDALACTAALVNLAFGAFPLTDCLGDILSLVSSATFNYAGAPATLGSWIADVLLAAVKCAAAALPVSAAITAAIKITEIIAFADDTLGVWEACGGGMRPSSVASVGVDRSCVHSSDPNGKYGPAGAGDAHFVTGEDPLTYAVAFENLETASGAAQDVVVTDVLDASRIDLDTFTLGPISFGSRLVVPPPGLSSYVTTVDLRPSVNLQLRIEAGLDRPTRTATWRFTSLDPSTGQPTTDPIAGFLPPNVHPPEGQGAVMFTATPLLSLTTNDVVRNGASIVFDTNAPIPTGEWANAIDKTKPTSAVLPIASPQASPEFEVRWSGADVGSGVADYTVFASVNGGPFSAWLANTAAPSATYHGASGSTYAFFSIARDRAGHVEAAKSVAEATVTVEVPADVEPPVTTGTMSPPPNAAGWHSVPEAIVSLSAVDVFSSVREIVYRASGAMTLPTTTTPGASASIPISAEGVTTVTYHAVDEAGNSEAEQSVVVRMDRTGPQLIAMPTPAPNAAGWNNTEVNVAFGCSDTLSGVEPGSVTPAITLSAEGVNQTAAGACRDLAGNLAAAAIVVNIDKTPPEAYTQLDPVGFDIQVFGRDGLSGTQPGPLPPRARKPMERIPASWAPPEREGVERGRDWFDHGRWEIRRYLVTDLAGNTLSLSQAVRRPHRGHELQARFVALDYSAPAARHGTGFDHRSFNLQSFSWVLGGPNRTLRRLDQEMTVGSGKGAREVEALYRAQAEETVIRSRGRVVAVRPGLSLLRTVTDRGQLRIELDR